jgi:predicted dehydrogenase/glycosyltransferase involved in cell wall biosynthesis
MRVLFDCSLLNAGGGIQVGLSAIRNALRWGNLEIGVISSFEMSHQISAEERSAMALFHAPQRGDFSARVRLTAQCPRIERAFSPDITFSVFGPAYWRSCAPRVQGFAIPRLIYPEELLGAERNLARRSWERVRDELKRGRLRRASQSDVWVVETEAVKARLCELYGIPRGRTFVIHNTYNAAFLADTAEPAESGNTANILVPAAYYPHKNLEVIPLVARRLREIVDKPFVFVLTLKPTHPAAVEIAALASRNGVEGAVQFVGEIPLAQLPTYYRRAAATFLPTLLECSTAVYPESFVSGVPVVTSDREFARELCLRGALYADPHDPGQLAEKLALAICDEGTRKALLAGGQEALKVNYLTPEEKWSQQLHLLDDVANERVGPRGARGSAAVAIPEMKCRQEPLHVYSDGRWHKNLVPYFPRRGFTAIKVLALCNLGIIDGLYFVRPRSMSLLFNYVRDIGFQSTARKVSSRSAETLRNEKFLSVGIGVVEETAGVEKKLVSFVATCHPEVFSRVSVPDELVFPLSRAWKYSGDDGAIRRSGAVPGGGAMEALGAVRGWSPDAGEPIAADRRRDLEQAALAVVDAVNWDEAERLEVPNDHWDDAQAGPREGGDASKVSASVFGYGNYTKSIIIPLARRFVSFDVIHEIDPTQLGARVGRARITTSPELLPGESTEAVFVASFHHTHASLACSALRAGKDVVLEKPLVTSYEQLDELVGAMEASGGRVFGCFQRRYTILNEYAREDLEWRQGMPISYHCIVYEVPLPARHWYRWPASRSRVLSNGCHWIDHFLFLNEYCPASAIHVVAESEASILCAIKLSNGASFSMVLTEEGSSRIGVQEHIELRTTSRTVHIDNGSSYLSEGEDGIIRRKSVHRMESYERMYGDIARNLRYGGQGDSIASVRSSSQVALDVEAAWAKAKARTHD